jgi:cobalt-zinc-cadmium efflux system membrane fusion protein
VKAESLVSSIRLVAPFEGFITEVHAVNGMFVNPPDFLCEIIDPTHLHIELKVFEKDLLKVRKGQKITFRIPEASKESFKGEIILIGKTVEGSERTIVVHGHITSAPLRNLTPGMYIEAQIHTDTRQMDGLPADALVAEEGKHFVFIRKTGQEDAYIFEKVSIKIGNIGEEWFEVMDSAGTIKRAGDNILVKGAYYLTHE